MALVQAVAQHTTVNPSSIGEASLAGSGLQRVRDRGWRRHLETTGQVEFNRNIEGTNPPSRSFQFPRGGRVTLESAGTGFRMVWQGNVDGAQQTITLTFGRNQAPRVTLPEEPMPKAPKK